MIVTRTLKAQSDFIQFFAKNRADLKREFPRLKEKLKQGGIIWVSWPKTSSGLKTDLTQGVVREAGLMNGLVDVKGLRCR